jgi:hypothetical protein
MTDHDTGWQDDDAWGRAIPPEIKDLECALTSAFHAFDDIEMMTMAHRIRVVNDVTGAVPDAASAAANAGYARWAASVVRAAAERRPGWSVLCGRWDAMIDASLDAISAVGVVA